MTEVASKQLHKAKPLSFVNTNSHALIWPCCFHDEGHSLHHAASGQKDGCWNFNFFLLTEPGFHLSASYDVRQTKTLTASIAYMEIQSWSIALNSFFLALIYCILSVPVMSKSVSLNASFHCYSSNFSLKFFFTALPMKPVFMLIFK